MPGARVKEGERVSLRTVEDEDVPFLQRGWANPEIRRLAGMQTRSRDEIDRVLKSGTHYLICLDDAGPGQPDEDAIDRVGWLWIDELYGNEYRPELATFVVPEFQGNDYAREATELGIDHVFSVSEHPAVAVETLGNNTAAQHILDAIGFREEGRLRKYTFSDGEYRDMIQYGMLRSEWYDRGETER